MKRLTVKFRTNFRTHKQTQLRQSSLTDSTKLYIVFNFTKKNNGTP